MTFQIRQLSTADYPFVISVLDQWWGGRQMADKLPVKHVGDTEEIAQAYLYLMRQSYSTGQVLVADGGAVLV